MSDLPTAVTTSTGLTAAEVAKRVAAGKVNRVDEQTSRPLSSIIRANVLTRFNAILGVLFVAVLAVGSPADALFGLVVVWNALIGIVQELRAKRTLDRLAVLNAPRAPGRAGRRRREIAVGEVVLDDVVRLRTGDQVPGRRRRARRATGLEIDESLLTGESDRSTRAPATRCSPARSSWPGSGTFQATAVGADAYAHRLAVETKQFTRSRPS